MGIELAPGNNQVGVNFAEFNLPAEVILLDSFNTTNQRLLIVGEEEDDFFGKTSATGYSRMYINSNDDRPRSEAILDSMFFTLDVVSVNGVNLDDPKYYSVHRLAEPILDTVYYNFNTLIYEEEPIAFEEITFGETKDTTLNLQVDEVFSEEIFGKMKRGPELENIFNFRDYFPGVAIKAREGDNTTVGINLGINTALVAYFHYDGDTVAENYRISTLSSRSFNGVQNDRTGTPTQIVSERGQNYDVGDIVGAKANLGMVIKLDTSPISEFLDSLSGIVFNQVTFEFEEIEEYPETQNPLFSGYLLFTDEENNFIYKGEEISPLTVQRTGQPQVEEDENGNLSPLNRAPAQLVFNETTDSYVTDLTSHINALFREQLNLRDWIFYGGIYSKRSTLEDDFKRSLRQMKINKNNIKVKAIYSTMR
ncbi:MAG: DUF4270 family protein [Bacteroidota bacterium]